MKIATFNVNGVNGRLPVLLRWLAEAKPDLVCLQELKAPQERFPAPALREAGYGAIWHGQRAGMESPFWRVVMIRSSLLAVSRATPRTRTAVISKRPSTAS